jgi:ABC-type multidrug transport system fused ATPase/permease subunit
LDPLHLHPDAALVDVLRRVALTPLLTSLPRGLATELDPPSLSAGQKQLICVARVLLRRARVVCLDEVSSNLDPPSHRALTATIRAALKGRTVVCVSHRLDVAAEADVVVVVEGGRVVEVGEPAALAAKEGGGYARMLEEARRDEAVG